MNKHHSLLHKVFFIGMFCCCAIAVVFLVNNQANSAVAETTTATLNNVGVRPIDGICGDINGTRVTTMPKENLCKSGTPSVVVGKIVEGVAGWVWKCLGINTGASNYCKVFRYAEIGESAVISKPTDLYSTNDTIGSSSAPVSTSTVSTATASQTAPTTAGTVKPVSPVSPVSTVSPTTNYQPNPTIESESVVGTTKTIIPMVINRDVPVSTSRSAITNTIDSLMSGRVLDDSEMRIDNRDIETNETANTMAIDLNNDEQYRNELGIPEDQVMRAQNVQKSVIVTEPVVIKAKKLLQNNNPKISGLVNASLKVETVMLNKRDDGKNNVRLAGKSEPNALVVIYIFSNDPVVISVKADANGDWNYELDRDLADGQHEAYIAVTDNAGKIISKSEPIAFVKTAQAATLIPLSELTDNQSPVERSSQQYVLIAIIIMFVCLAVALALIGFLTHKRNLDEGIN